MDPAIQAAYIIPMSPSDIQVAAEAETRLPELLDRAERGERFTITRHGRAIAHPVPAAPAHDIAAAQAAVEELFPLGDAIARNHGPFTLQEILSARDEGRH